jgi:DNA-binding NtrC family response regulator
MRGSVRRAVLVIDDDQVLCRALVDGLAPDCTEVLTASTAEEGLAICARQVIDVVLLDQKLPDVAGHELPPRILEQNELTKIVFMTAFPSFDNALRAIRAGAHDYLCKPFELEEIQLSIERALRVQELERIEQLHALRHRREMEGLALAGEACGLAGVSTLARRAAATMAPVLLTGETGTGKTLLARYIHRLSPSRSEPFIAVNCGALPESLAEAELFGFEKGSFTGASGSRRGVFEMAEGGSVLLDEIGAMPVALQAKLLGVLEDRQVRRIGGERQREVRARVMAATNRDLEAAVGDGGFRQDLYFRLDVLRIEMPPLRERPGDLKQLVEVLLGRLGGDGLMLADGELDRLAAYAWPGNVRELRNVLERSIILAEPGPLRPSSLLPAAAVEGSRRPEALVSRIATLEEVERDHIGEALLQLSGNLTRTADALGIALSTLKRKVARYGLQPRRESASGKGSVEASSSL